MNILKHLLVGILTPLVQMSCLAAAAQTRTVALTFDDLPVAVTQGPTENPAGAQSVNRALLEALKKHRAPAIGFVNGKTAEELGNDNGKQILQQWAREGLDLGNHTFSHADLNNITLEQFKQEVVTGEDSFRQPLAEVGKTPRYLRFPYNPTGDTKEKHDSVALFLKQRGYRIAPSTIDHEDYLVNAAYVQMLATFPRCHGRDAQHSQLRNAGVNGFRSALQSLLALVLFLAESGPRLLLWLIILSFPGWLLGRRYQRPGDGFTGGNLIPGNSAPAPAHLRNRLHRASL